MKNLVRTTAVALLAGAVTWATGTAWAALAPGDLACQRTIRKYAIAYINKTQLAASAMMDVSQRGTGNAAPRNICMSGPRVGKTCIGNNGGCNLARIPCNSNADCQSLGGPFATDVCNPGLVVPGLYGGCNPSSPLDTNECQPRTNAAVAKAQTDLLRYMTRDCNAASPDNIGLTRMSDCLIGTCAGGTSNAAPCNADNGATVCTGGGFCDFGGSSGYDWIAHLAACIEASADGDFGTGKIVDTVLRPLAKMTGTGVAANAEGLGTDPLPRELIQLNGSQWLAIGTAAGSEVGSQLGAVQYLSLATCSLSPGNGARMCRNNADCVGGTCTRNAAVSNVCVSTSLNPTPVPCSSDADCVYPSPCTACDPGDSCGGGWELTGSPVHKCCSGSTTTSCATDANCPPGTAPCTYTGGCGGNVLSVSQTSSNGSTTCLVTRTWDAGNQTTTRGVINLTTGAAVTQSPIRTDVYLIGPPYTGCGRCQADRTCDGNSANSGDTCTGAAGQIDQGCFPAGAFLGTIPNRFILTTGTKTMTPGSAPRKFCGYCCSLSSGCTPSNSGTDYTIGCQVPGDCPPKPAPTPSDTCDFNETYNNGFYGDSTATQVTATGEAHQYAPTYVGVFCTGKTSSPLVNSSAGLPGPVRIIQPYIFGYNFSRDN